MNALLSQLFPLLYGACFLALLWQAFKVMGQGFRAVPRPGDRDAAGTTINTTATIADPTRSPRSGNDRTGRLTIHPELLDADGQLTQEDLLTVRFSGDNEQPAYPGDAS
jgi:hypothetical protein